MSETATDQIDDGVVSRSLSAAPLHVWEVLVSDAGAEALLGPGARLGRKGDSWRSDAGPSGVVRSVHPLEQLRVSFHEDDDSPNSLVQIDLRAEGDATRIDLTHSDHQGDQEADRRRWGAALDRLGALL